MTSELARANFLLLEALEDDEAGRSEEAVETYSQAVELCLKARKKTEDEELKRKLASLATQALERAEAIKRPKATSPKPSPKKPAAASRVVPPLGLESLNLRDASGPILQPVPGAVGGGYSEEEKRVLAKTSLINGREYVPFHAADLRERFAFPVPFSDRHGKLTLAPKQRAKLVAWMRPDEFMRGEPRVLQLVDCYSVTQTVVSDCSFVASIAISAQYEKRFKKRLITSIIFPQNRAGCPVYNPCGEGSD